MKRFLLFAGTDYYPAGGWDDFRGDFDNVENARAKGQKEYDYWWFHIVDTTTMKKLEP